MNDLYNEKKNVSMRKLGMDEMAEINGGMTAKKAACLLGMAGVGSSYALAASFIPVIGLAITAGFVIGAITAIGSELVCYDV